MSCYHPKKGFELGINPTTGKKEMKICSYKTYYVVHEGRKIYDYVPIPCGNCIGCKLDYSKSWAIRCMLESSFYDENYFITLTYDDENNPRNLIKDDLRKFIKKLRTYLVRSGKPEIRFFSCGEYGSKTLRPHFHLIVFNLKLDDKKLYKRSPTGDNLYTSEFISNIWNKGFAIIGDVTYNSCGYVARYCMKKFKKNDMTDFNFNNEFILMSRRPGIGSNYFDEHKTDIYKYDSIYFNFGNSSNMTPPKYYDRLLDKIDPDLLKKIKDKRKLIADLNNLNKSLNTTINDELEYLRKCESNKIIQTNILKRSKL